MKLILTGTNGFIGSEILALALTQKSVTSLITLSRKPLPAPFNAKTHPKLKSIILEDFSSYPPSILSELEGADACIWTIGAKSLDTEVIRKVTIEYSLTAARTFADLAKQKDQKFRFVFISGFVIVRDQTAHTLFYPKGRKLAGQAEINLLQLAKERPDEFEAYIMRPAFVLGKERTLGNAVKAALGYTVSVDELASVLLDVAEKGAEKDTWENAELRTRGRELVRRAEGSEKS